MNKLKERYEELYHIMATSGDVNKMKTFGKAENWAFDKMLSLSEEDAERWIDRLESIIWCNYVSEEEAESIVDGFVNQDGTKGAHWDYNTLKDAVKDLGNYMHEEPYYNCYALWVTMNMIYSDHAVSIGEYLEDTDAFKLMYGMSVEKLKDRDHQSFIRSYFDL